ncbi:MAG TPA: DUF6680 family protein [Bauldia sp.]|nr:DUF6680 family protein [Bauldia sp.]
MTTGDVINALILAASVIAILLGPIIAVRMTRKQDAAREDRQRKLDLYRTMMHTRSSRLSVDHVRALNTIPVEFNEVPAVMTAFRSYMNLLGAPMPAVDQQERFFEQRNDHFLDLIYQMGLFLGYQFDRRELERLAYVPQGFINDEERNHRAQAVLLEILEGRRPLPVTWMMPPGAQNPFPPLPEPPALAPPGNRA